jgi:hypothetical protein
LRKHNTKDKENSRVLRKALRLIDPKLRKCRRQNEQSDYEILRRFRLLATKDKKSKAASKRGEDEKLRI